MAKLFKEPNQAIPMPRTKKYSHFHRLESGCFILVLLFLLGLVLHSQLLRPFSGSRQSFLEVCLCFVSFITFLGILRYTEPADKHYLLVKEERSAEHMLKKATEAINLQRF